jgi:hypothetical protein
MKTAMLILLLVVGTLSFAKDKDYQIGSYLGHGSALDGTYTNNVQCHDNIGAGFTCAGDSGFNQVTLYKIKSEDGIWILETYRQALDTTARKWVGEPVHLKSEKSNLLDALKSGDRVMFRVERHRKIGGTETDVFIPRADNPNKEEKNVGDFVPAVAPVVPVKPTDNIKAMCESGKLTPEQKTQLCQRVPGSPEQSPAQPPAPELSYQSANISATALAQAQTLTTDMKTLVGHNAVVQRMPFYQPGTFRQIPNTYAGQTVTIIEVKPSTMFAMMPTLTASQLASLPPQSQQAIENTKTASTIVVQFQDGTKADTGAMPVMASTLPTYLELLPDKKPSPAVPTSTK